ncbi:YtfJ family protein [Agarivorans sp. MS3-6]|uniref:YtfJ family protein n=1 Tax=Agarivorans sp. TSD2052 TaxID=2937286 RepID=UPI00200F1A15|nr:YtfJ family protein [Agarivorans sp. TSD2052]UPW19222.1 YtfJ family protein [Agarivorans sp. TSD2052]
MKHLLLLLGLLPAWAMALNINPGTSLPAITIENTGELLLDKDDISYQKWSSEQLTGKVRLLQVMAGRSSAKELNAPMIEAVKQAKFAETAYQTVTIVNLDDAIFGTSSFVKNKLKKNKKDFPQASFVLDKKGKLFDLWKVQPKSSAIILLDVNGQVLFAKDGALNEQDINQVIHLIETNI